MGMERRLAPARVELRANGTEVRIVGYASRFSTPYSVAGFTEKVAPGAFTETLAASPDVRLLIDHEGQPLARTKYAHPTATVGSQMALTAADRARLIAAGEGGLLRAYDPCGTCGQPLGARIAGVRITSGGQVVHARCAPRQSLLRRLPSHLTRGLR